MAIELNNKNRHSKAVSMQRPLIKNCDGIRKPYIIIFGAVDEKALDNFVSSCMNRLYEYSYRLIYVKFDSNNLIDALDRFKIDLSTRKLKADIIIISRLDALLIPELIAISDLQLFVQADTNESSRKQLSQSKEIVRISRTKTDFDEIKDNLRQYLQENFGYNGEIPEELLQYKQRLFESRNNAQIVANKHLNAAVQKLMNLVPVSNRFGDFNDFSY